MDASQKYIYQFKYDYHHHELSQLEARQLFGYSHEHKCLISHRKASPTISPFIKYRCDVMIVEKKLEHLVQLISSLNIRQEKFKISYLVTDYDQTPYEKRLSICRQIGFQIEGEPDYNTPEIVYSICLIKNIYYFGILHKNVSHWQQHKTS